MLINQSTDILIVIDPQNDFCPGGALAVAGGNEIMAGINTLAEKFDNIVITQDWHPVGHKSFASSQQPIMGPDNTPIPVPETGWPDHCVAGTLGADFHADILPTVNKASLILRKGTNLYIDSYSAFLENDKRTCTGLAAYLHERGIRKCYFVGLALDVCVAHSAIDALTAAGYGEPGFGSVVIEDLSRAISDDTNDIRNEMLNAGVEIIISNAIEGE